MQNAGTVLDVLRDRGRRGLPCTELYRQLFNPWFAPASLEAAMSANRL